ncbi:hypothetical protein [Brachybacterium sp. GPGPB12]|uniref:hypothetical protein n=1 Tax=Brachybacterium sp. GPGPB12 TaxID=3023517 RepID=UPI00313441F8
MTTLYRPVQVTNFDQLDELPPGSFMHPDCRNGGILTYLVPIEAEEEWTAMGSDNGEPWIAHVGHDGIDGSREEAQQYVDRFGGFIAHRTRTPWEEAQ